VTPPQASCGASAARLRARQADLGPTTPPLAPHPCDLALSSSTAEVRSDRTQPRADAGDDLSRDGS
jgi:hypothetical protein